MRKGERGGEEGIKEKGWVRKGESEGVRKGLRRKEGC